MKKYLKTIVIFLIAAALQISNIPVIFAEDSEKTITILFTNDIHDHMIPSSVVKDGVVKELGGFARLQSAINSEREVDKDLLLLDAGDFSMGTLFQSLYTSEAPQLRLMGQMGYDVVTLGNHEFDYRATGLADMLSAAKNSGEKLPEIVQGNMTFPTNEQGQLTDSLANLKDSINKYGVKEYTIIEKNGVKIGVFGVMGEDSASKAPMSEVRFSDKVENAKRIVKTLKEDEKVDLIVCLSHSGIWDDKSESEDEILAEKVPEINIILSGHTHTKLEEPIMVGQTIIGSTGEYSENLGVLKISKDSDNKWSLNNYKLKEINNSYKDDSQILSRVNSLKNLVQENYLNYFGIKFDEVLAKSDFNFVSTSERENKHREDTLGNLISDAYIYAVKKAEGKEYQEVTAAIVPCGTIRGSFVKGDIKAADVFTVSSIGMGPDKKSGYPLISAYLTGEELKTICEVDASIAPMMKDAQLFMSGLNFTFNPNRLIFNKVTDTKIEKTDGSVEEIDDKKLYRVIVDLYTAQMLSVVGDKSHGLLSITPKTKDGAVIANFEDMIINENINGNSNELKVWFAVAEYLKSFDKNNGVSQIPTDYSKAQGRKVINDSHNIIQLLKNPNKIALAAYSIIIIVICIIGFIIYRIKTRKKRRENFNSKIAVK